MKKLLPLFLSVVPILLSAAIPDSVYVQPYAPQDGSGLFLSWSSNGTDWRNVTDGRILGSDYGAWGREKKLYYPSLAQGADGTIALVFQVNDHTNQFAVTWTKDFIHWRPQDYPYMSGVGQCLEPVVTYADGTYRVAFHNQEGKWFYTCSKDLISFTDPIPCSSASRTDLRLPYTLLTSVRDNQVAFQTKAARENELAKDNAQRFSGLNNVTATVRIDAATPRAISTHLMGIFFEDINYSADGGLNAQLVQNGDFEYDPHDRGGDARWNTLTAWETSDGAALADVVKQVAGISVNNNHALSFAGSILNTGFDGIVLQQGAKYTLSLYLKGKVRAELVADDRVLASATLKGGTDWKKVSATLTPSASATQSKLRLTAVDEAVTVDMVSLLPRDTYKGHGLRRDLCETLEALHPRFMRFPGGCVAHGDGLGNIYHWKETIGDVKDRKPLRNLWGYHQSRQIGYYEFFQLCEDMGMEPLPVLSAGVPCQNSSDGGGGQQGGIPMNEMDSYIQDVLDLIEWANGDATTTWGRKRIEQGHKKPFGLKYIGIGNEDLISPTFEERYLMICRAVKEKYPEIQICGTAGPFYYGSDYDEGWRIATEHKDIIDLVDEHYYVSPGWYIYNQDFYDQYDRTAPKVYLGEWAAHIPGRKSTVETALSEALHFCSLERNGDVVAMSSYAPLLAKEGHTQWNPDMIYFNNSEVKPTVGYYAQKMCGNSQGNEYLPVTIRSDERREGVQERLAVSCVRDTRAGKTYLKLVNILPVEVTATLQTGGLLTDKNYTTTTLSGAYDSVSALPETHEVHLSEGGTIVLPAYSFTVVEL